LIFSIKKWLDMKTVYAVILVFLLLSCGSGDRKKPIVGYVVYKEHTPVHMCHSAAATYYEAKMPNVAHTHIMVGSTSFLLVADKKGVHRISLSKSRWDSFHVTDKVRVDSKGISLVSKGCNKGILMRKMMMR
jgi:hypothetical protein